MKEWFKNQREKRWILALGVALIVFSIIGIVIIGIMMHPSTARLKESMRDYWAVTTWGGDMSYAESTKQFIGTLESDFDVLRVKMLLPYMFTEGFLCLVLTILGIMALLIDLVIGYLYFSCVKDELKS